MPEHAAVRVLVVEDEESYRQALSSGLGREGFEVVLAADGPEGIRLFETLTRTSSCSTCCCPG